MDQTKITALSDSPAGDTVRAAGVMRSFAKGGLVSEPTPAQKEAGNYQKRHMTVHGMNLSIENEKGSTRSGTGKDGKKWSVAMPAHYGYIKGTEGKDGDHVDVYLGPLPQHPMVHVVNQIDHVSGRFDEHKAMVGFRSKDHALDTYHRGFSDGHGPDRVGSVASLPVNEFKDWVSKGKRTQPLKVDRTHTDPYLAGISDDHRTLYIDKRVPKTLTVKGKTFDPAKYLGVHEEAERKLMDNGMKYEPAHRLALKSERKAVVADGIDWNGYQEVMHRLAAITQREKPAQSNPPRDLYEGPFRGDPKEEATIEKEGVKHFAEGGLVEDDDDDNDLPVLSDEEIETKGYRRGETDDLPVLSDEEIEANGYRRGTASSAVGAFGRGVVEGAVPAAGGIAGAGLGAEAGMALGALGGPAAPVTIPLGGVVGGLAGAFGGASLAGNVQDWFLEKLGLLDREQRAADEEQHPYARMAGNLAPNLAAFNPAGTANVVSRAAGAAIGGGTEAAQEKLAGADFDPTKIAMAAGAMALMNKPTAIGKSLLGAGERAGQSVINRLPQATQDAINAGKRRAGRPDMNPEEPQERLALPAPPDFTTSPEGETARYPGGDDQVFDQTAAPRPGTQEENARPVYEMPRDQYQETPTQDNSGAPTTPPDIAPRAGGSSNRGTPTPANENVAGQSQPGTSPIDNIALPASTPEAIAPGAKTAEFIAKSKVEAAPARNTGSTLGTAHVQAPPDRTVGTVGSNPDHPLSVGSERDYRATADSNVHPTTSGSGERPAATPLDPAKGNISPEVEQALTDQVAPDEQNIGQQTGQERTQIGPEVPPIADTGIDQGAVTDTVTKLRDLGLVDAAEAVKNDPKLEPQAREVMESPEGLRQFEQIRQEKEARALEATRLMQEGVAKRAQGKKYVPDIEREAPSEAPSEANAARRETEGQVTKVGDETITSASQRKATLVKRAADAAQSAYDKYATGKLGAADYSELGARLRDALAHAKVENLDVHALQPLPRKRTSAQEWLKAAQDLVGTPENPKTIRRASAMKFMGDERMLLNGAKAKEIRGFNKVESDVALNKRNVTQDPVDSAIHDWVSTLPEKERGAWEAEFGPAERQVGDWETDDWGERSAGKKPDLDNYGSRADFWTNENGSFNPKTFMQDFRGFFGKRNQAFAKTFAAKTTDTWRAAYANDVAERLYALNKNDDTNWLNGENEASKYNPALRDPKKFDPLYHALERDDLSKLPQDVQDAYNKELKPQRAFVDDLYDKIHQLSPGLLGDKVANYLSRIPRELAPDFSTSDPIAQVMASRRRGLKLSASQTQDRQFMVIEDPNGKRTVVSDSPAGYREWTQYISQERQNANFDMKVGTTFRDAANVLQTVKNAYTSEIEANGMFANGKKATYYHNPVMSVHIAKAELQNILAHLQYLESIKPELMEKKLATQDAGLAKEWAKPDGSEPWEKTQMPQMKNFYMTPRLREVFDDYASPGLTSDKAWDMVSRASAFVTKMLFLNPIFHIANVGVHWFGDRGWKWIQPKAYRDLATTGVDAIRSVLSQDTDIRNSSLGKYLGVDSPDLRRFQDEARSHAAGLQFGGVLNQNKWHNIAKAAGEVIATNPSKWDPIARVMGISAVDLGRAVMRASSKTMWAANDIFHTQLVMERIKNGMTMKDAIRETEKHFPAYKVPSRVIGSGAMGRWIAQALRDNNLFAFGPYHYGVFNHYAHIVKDSVQGTGEERVDALGKMFALGVLAFAVYPAWDKAVKLITGNEKAEARRRGSLALPAHIIRGLQGKEDILNTAPATALSLSPLVGGALAMHSNRDFAGRPLVEPGDVARMAKGPNRLQAAGLVATQAAHAGANAFYAPYSMANKALTNKSGSALAGARDQLLDIQERSPAGERYERQAAHIKEAAARQRARKGGRSAVEDFYDKATK